MKIKTEQVIEVSDWDDLVHNTYNKPYHFQQQNGCQSRGTFRFSVPDEETYDAEMPDSIPEIVNHNEMGVKFDAWKARDPKLSLISEKGTRNEQWAIDLWWSRNFYPDFQTVANDLHAKGLLPAGKYTINIDW